MYFRGATPSGDVYSTSLESLGSGFTIVDEITAVSYHVSNSELDISFDNGITWISYSELKVLALW